ncbi:MAG: crosslink repair DNA glycosylase YcaQ family protein, partial [Myxococcota bacterium]
MTTPLTVLRRTAVHHAFFEAPDAATAVKRLGFVQADPIRSPARAQDLILHQRVQQYRMGDLARCYPDGGLDEGLFYAYGFVSSETWPLLQMRRPDGLDALESRVLAAVHDAGPTHPNDVAALGGPRRRNAWG